jgi:hypothetical protein
LTINPHPVRLRSGQALGGVFFASSISEHKSFLAKANHVGRTFLSDKSPAEVGLSIFGLRILVEHL